MSDALLVIFISGFLHVGTHIVADSVQVMRCDI